MVEVFRLKLSADLASQAFELLLNWRREIVRGEKETNLTLQDVEAMVLVEVSLVSNTYRRWWAIEHAQSSEKVL